MAALGLEPGADRDAVEKAYRRLIKHHHPDREGGDAARAAELNKAYRELREERVARDGLVFHDPVMRPSDSRFAPWAAIALALVVASLSLLFIAGRSAPLVGHGLAGTARTDTGKRIEPMRQPIATGAIAAGVRDAQRIARSGDEMALSSASRDCHDRLRTAPSMDLLDRCAAFDDAVTVLQDRDPMRDRGPFSELAVTGRQWSAARGLSDDFVAIDGRLDQIRLRVELMLAGSGAGAT